MPVDFAAATCILTPEVIERKLKRMAYEVAEHNVGEQELLVYGVEGNGEVLAAAFVEQLRAIIPAKIHKGVIRLQKTHPVAATTDPVTDFNNKVVIVVDDVSNTGRTLLYALAPLLQYMPKKIQTLVLVERSHKEFAVQPDYVGLSIATTLQEHIRVEAEGDILTGAWLY